MALFVGAVLGVLGAGGASLAVPALVYIFGIPPREATHLSLGIVGLVALLGISRSRKSGEVDVGWTLRFFLPSSVGVVAARKFLIPWIPEGADFVLMLLLAVMLLLAARAMLKRRSNEEKHSLSTFQFSIRSFGVGVVTGLLGAGGGFLIVPILSIWAGLGFRQAAATSLAVIFLNSALGFAAGWTPEAARHLPVLAVFVGVAGVGLLLSRRLARNVPQEKLRQGFAYFLVAVALFTLAQELASRL